jgi:putative thioredoxin
MSSAKPAWIIDVQQGDFDREVIQRSHDLPVVVDFWAPWCDPCRMLGPVLERLAQEREGGFVLAKVDIDQAQDLARQFRIEAIPAVQAFRDGKPFLGFVGVLPEQQLREFIDRILPTQKDQLVKQAGLLESTDLAQAERLYRQVLAQDRNHEAAGVGLARLLVARGQDREAEDLLANFGPGGELGAETERLNGILALRKLTQGMPDEATIRQRLEKEPENAELHFQLGCALASAERYREALEALLAAAERDRQLAGTKVRELMVKIFHIVGVRSELADEYRDKLSRLLY